ncbi:MAG: hypothetical protein ACJAUV_000555 [Flavobacteriales bacterium]|jgi:hypothetical protein
MRKITLAVLAMCTIGFTSCDKADELLDVDVNGSFTETVKLNYPESAEEQEFVLVEEINLNDNADFAKYGDKIKSIEISKLTVEIDSALCSDTTEIQANFTMQGDNGLIVTKTFDRINVKDSDMNNTIVLEATLTGDEAAAIGSLFLSVKKMMLSVNGIVYNAPLAGDLILTVDAKVKASPLD